MEEGSRQSGSSKKPLQSAPTPLWEARRKMPQEDDRHQYAQRRSAAGEPKPLDLIWINLASPIVAAGLATALEGQARLHLGPEPPPSTPSALILQTDDKEELSR